jgi:hypothetical protein
MIKSLFSIVHNHRGSPYFFSEWSSLFLLPTFVHLSLTWKIAEPCDIFLRNNHGKWLMVVNLEKSFSIRNCSMGKKILKILYTCLKKRFITFLAHLTQNYCHHLASVVVVRRKLFQKSSPLKVLDQWKPNLVWIITRVSSFKIVSSDAVHQPTWPLLLKIEHMVKLQVLGNNPKTVNNIKNLTWDKNDQHIKIYLPCNFEVNLITHSWSCCPFFIKFVKF